MNNAAIRDAFEQLSTPLIADACVRLALTPRAAPSNVRPLHPRRTVAGHARPVRHHGSVDIFLEALEDAEAGDVLVIDNNARTDEGCIGDLVVLEVQAAGFAGILVWGHHRDSHELLEIGLPVFSTGACPVGPWHASARARDSLDAASFGDVRVRRDDVAFADDDGILFVAEAHAAEVIGVAREILRTERQQAMAVREGKSLRAQFAFAEYLRKREVSPAYTFREHLRGIGKAIEE